MLLTVLQIPPRQEVSLIHTLQFQWHRNVHHLSDNIPSLSYRHLTDNARPSLNDTMQYGNLPPTDNYRDDASHYFD